MIDAQKAYGSVYTYVVTALTGICTTVKCFENLNHTGLENKFLHLKGLGHAILSNFSTNQMVIE